MENTKSSNKQIAGAIIVAGVLIAGAILLKGNMPKDDRGNQAQNNPSKIQLKEVAKDEHILGNPSAKIQIVEYSDTECPFCKVFHATMQKTIKNSDGKVAWVYRHYPIPQLHPKAQKESEATECAFEQGDNTTFWKYTDEIYARTASNNKLDVAELPKIAKDLGLDVAKFNTCLESGKYANKVENDISSGVAVGVNGTPKSFILKDGKVVDTIDGAQPYEVVEQKIKALLK